MLLFDRFELFGFPQTTYICDRKVQLKSLKHMITSRKISQINVFAGSPWEVESVKQLLKVSLHQPLQQRTKVMAFTCLCLASSTLSLCGLSVTEKLIRLKRKRSEKGLPLGKNFRRGSFLFISIPLLYDNSPFTAFLV